MRPKASSDSEFDKLTHTGIIYVSMPGAVMQQLLEYVLRQESSTGIVYCMTKKDCEIVSDWLRDNGVSSSGSW